MSRREADASDLPKPGSDATRPSTQPPPRTISAMRAETWDSTAFGPVDSWPAALVGAVAALRLLPAAGLLWWGPDRVHLHNEAFARELGELSPPPFGQPARVAWPAADRALDEVIRQVADTASALRREVLIEASPADGPVPTHWNVAVGPANPDRPADGVLIVARNVTTEADARRLATAQAENLQLALASNRRIGTAIGILMAQRRITDTAAFDLLRDVSQRDHRKLREVADDVVLTGALPGPG